MISKRQDAKKRVYSLETCKPKTSMIKAPNASAGGADNRDIVDNGKSQTLSQNDIEDLRYAKGAGSKEMLQHLVKNSKTFKEKTDFSQEKYLKRKEKKYFEYIQVQRPTLRLLADIFYRQDPEKILGLRKDTLSQILTSANISNSGNYLIYDSGTNGLLVAAVLNMTRRHTGSSLVHVHPGGGHYLQKQALAALQMDNVGDEHFCSANIYSVLRHFYQEHNVAQEPPQKKMKPNIGTDDIEQVCSLLKQGVDAMIVLSKELPNNLLAQLLKFVKPSKPVIVYSQSKEVLADLYVELKLPGCRMTALKLTSNWMRNYQVLENRTHPEVMMAGNSGYLLVGVTTK